MAVKKNLPEIPDKRYFTISEASELCVVKPHVLRYWEQEFTHLKPSKRRGNRRYYQHKDILTIRMIRELLYDKGFTIAGAKHQLTQLQRNNPQPEAPQAAPAITAALPTPAYSQIIEELQNLLKILKEPA